MNSHRRHDISDKIWEQLSPCLPGRDGAWGGKARDNRQFINAELLILRTGTPWRDLPPETSAINPRKTHLFLTE